MYAQVDVNSDMPQRRDVTRLLTAVAMMTGPRRLSVIRQSAFLPALLSGKQRGPLDPLI